MPLGTSATLRDLSWYRPGLGYIVGDGGTLILVDKQNPDPLSVKMFNLGTHATLNAVDVYNEDKGCLVGTAGTLYCLTGKNTWQPRFLGTTATLYDVSFVRKPVAGTLPGVGWVVGDRGVIRRTADHGVTWDKQDLTGYTFYAVYARSSTEAWVGGRRQSDDHAVIWHTGDGGISWQLQYASSTQGAIRSIHGNDDHIWAVGDNGMVLHTEDRGTTWRAVATEQAVSWTGVWQAPSASVDGGGNVWIAGQSGVILRSPDEGKTWVAESPGTSANVRSINFFNAYHGSAAVGDNGLFLWREAQKRRLQAYWAETPPVLDGDLSEWVGAPHVRLNVYTADLCLLSKPYDLSTMPYDLNGYDLWAQAAWDNTYLYLAFKIHDNVIREDNTPSKPYYDDEIEIALDGPPIGEPDQGDAWPNGTDHQYTVNPSGFVTDLSNPALITPGSVDVYTRTIPGGWTVEMRIRKDELGLSSLSPGTTWGFTWAYHDDDKGPPGSTYETYCIWEGYNTWPGSAAVLAGYGSLILEPRRAPWVSTSTPTPTPTPSPTPTPTETPATGIISGRVFADLNHNGVFDPGESGVAGAFIRILRNGTLLEGETTTSPEGTFNFPALTPGYYAISESPPAGYTNTTARVQWKMLAPGDILTVYFGEIPPATPTPTATLTPTPTSTPRRIYLPYFHVP